MFKTVCYRTFIFPSVKHRRTTLKVVSLDPAGGWTPPVTVPRARVLLHLSRKESKSGTAPSSVAARSSQRKPGRARATERAAAQVSQTLSRLCSSSKLLSQPRVRVGKIFLFWPMIFASFLQGKGRVKGDRQPVNQTNNVHR